MHLAVLFVTYGNETIAPTEACRGGSQADNHGRYSSEELLQFASSDYRHTDSCMSKQLAYN